MIHEDIQEQPITFEQFTRQVNNSIFSYKRAIEILNRESFSSKENKMVLEPILHMLNKNLDHCHQLIEKADIIFAEYEKTEEKEINKKEAI